MSALSTQPPSEPGGRVVAGTHPLELQRLALQELISPTCDPLTTQAFLWLSRAYSAAITRTPESLRPAGLSMSGFNILMALHNTPGNALEPHELSERLLVSRPSVTGLLDTLEARRLICRQRHPQDKRRVLVAITEQGEATLAELVHAHYGDISALFTDLSPDELETLVMLLRRVDGAVPPALRE